jgi:hypothetical protein
MTVLGLPVLTVQRAGELLDDGDLDGRFAAVLGYYASNQISCPAEQHHATLDLFCYFVTYTDEDRPEYHQLNTLGAEQGAGVLEPVLVADSAGSVAIWNEAPPPSGAFGAQRMILILHAGDTRLWECKPQRRNYCRGRVVVDRIVWLDGDSPDPVDGYSELSPVRTTQDVMQLAAHSADEVVVSAYAVDSPNVISIDPRLAGKGQGILWVARVLSGSVSADGVSDGVVRLIADETGDELLELPLGAANEYAPARLLIDSDDRRTRSGSGYGLPQASATSADGAAMFSGYVGIFDTPIVLDPGSYTVRAWLEMEDGSIAEPGPCKTTLDLESLEEAYLLERFSSSGHCTWPDATPPPNV